MVVFLLISIIRVSSQNTDFPKRIYSKEKFPCLESSIYTDLDFALGNYEIITNDLLVGTIKLERDAKGCMIKEKFTILNGYSGAGFDYYDKNLNIWIRTLVVSNGTVETFEGSKEGDKFIWKGKEVRFNGDVVFERVEMWREGSKVINNIFQSFDNGKTWKQTGAEIRIPLQ